MFLHFVTLWLWLFDLKTISLVGYGYPKVVLYTKFEDFEIIRFSYAADRQTDAQTDADERFTPATVVGDGE